MEISVPLIENPLKPNKKKGNTLAPRKRKMIEALTSELGIVTTACQIAGINSWTHYEWLKRDPIYKEAVEALDIRKDDLIEKAFLSLVIDKNPSAVIHAVKTKLKHRGYGEDPIINNQQSSYTFKIIKPEEKSDDKSS
jgi:hypothetical protein